MNKSKQKEKPIAFNLTPSRAIFVINALRVARSKSRLSELTGYDAMIQYFEEKMEDAQ